MLLDGLSLPRGIPAASLKRAVQVRHDRIIGCLPRGIPAASLKPSGGGGVTGLHARLPRGIPAASLKPALAGAWVLWGDESSAGNTRGLIEAKRRTPTKFPGCRSSAGNTRGLIEA